jgi:hypothetical protein
MMASPFTRICSYQEIYRRPDAYGNSLPLPHSVRPVEGVTEPEQRSSARAATGPWFRRRPSGAPKK